MKRTLCKPSRTTQTLIIIFMLALLSISLVHAGPCGAVDFNVMTISTNKSKCGFTELCDLSSPPKYYLKETITGGGGGVDRETFISDDNSYFNGSDNIVTLLQENFVYTVDRFSCVTTLNASGTSSYIETGIGTFYAPYTWNSISTVTNSSTGVWDGGFSGPQPWNASWPEETNSSQCSPTLQTTSADGNSNVLFYFDDDGYPDSGWYDDYENNGGQVVTTLENEYTDDMLRRDLLAIMPPYPDWSGDLKEASSAFFHWGDTNHFSCNGGKMRYRLHVTDCVPNESYLVKWDEITTYDNPTISPSVTHLKENVTGNGDPVNGVYTSEREQTVPSTPCTIYEANATVKVLPTSAGAGDGGGGGGGPILGN